MQRSHSSPSVSRRQVLTALAAGTTCVATGASAIRLLDVATPAPATLGFDAPQATATVPFVLSF